MDSLKKHGDPLEEEISRDAVRGAEVVGNNQPGSKGDGSQTRAGAGTRDDETGDGDVITRSANQKPNANQSAEEATMEPGGDLGQKRTTM